MVEYASSEKDRHCRDVSMRFWLEYDWIALAVLIFGLAAVELLALNI